VCGAVCHAVRRRGTSECGDGAQLWRRRCAYVRCPVMQWWLCGPCRRWTLRCPSPLGLMSLSPACRSVVGSSARSRFCVISVIVCLFSGGAVRAMIRCVTSAASRPSDVSSSRADDVPAIDVAGRAECACVFRVFGVCVCVCLDVYFCDTALARCSWHDASCFCLMFSVAGTLHSSVCCVTCYRFSCSC
jgi:hypothetical protein